MFRWSAFLFRIGLALEIFEQIRPAGVLLADFAFGASLLLLLLSEERRLLKSKGSGVMAAAAVILCGTLPSGPTDPGVKLFVLFGLFAPLAIAHAKNIRKNLLYVVAGVSANCLIAILAASVWPKLEDTLAVTADVVDPGQDIGRFSGLAGHPTILGFSAALAILIAIGLLFFEKNIAVRGALIFSIPLCTIGALVSGSRNFFACLIPALVVFMIWRAENRKRIVRGICAVVVVLFLSWTAIAYLVPDVAASYTERLTKIDVDDTENYGRLLTAGMALYEISQKPLTGYGTEQFGEAGMVYLPTDQAFMPAHVTFLHYWYSEGILGAIGFLLLFVLPIRRMWQTLKRNPSDTFLQLGVCVVLLLFIASNLQPVLLNRFLYMPLFVFAGLCAVAPKAASSGLSSQQHA
jgi:O-antigen ligase